jgi:predicted nucleotidyltransferase
MGNKKNKNHLCTGLFGKTRQAVLALLYGQADTSFYTRQIFDAVKTGRGAVQRELENLSEEGIIVREVWGRQVYYRANDKCPIFNELKGIVRKTFGVADILRQNLMPLADKIRVAFIFGSVARSTDERKSDIDLMVVGEVPFGDVVALLSGAEEALGREVNPVVYPVDEFRHKVEKGHHFVTSVLGEQKIFLIGDEIELGRLAERRQGRTPQYQP